MFETYLSAQPELRQVAVRAGGSAFTGKLLRRELGPHLARMVRRARRKAAAGIVGRSTGWLARQPLSAAELCHRMIASLCVRTSSAAECETVRGL